MEKVPIIGLSNDGKSIAKVDGQVVFVKGAVPGDVADLRVFKKRSKFMEANPVHFHQYSPDRIEPTCKHFGTCGGCKWQNLSYAKQLEFKQQQVVENLKRIGKIDLPDTPPILASPEDTYYRNKLEFTFTNRKWLTKEEITNAPEDLDRRGLGFHVPGKFDKVLDVEHCYLQPDPSNAIRTALRDFAKENGITFFDLLSQEGLLRNLVIRTASTGETMVIVIFAKPERENIELVMDFMKNKFPEITSLQYIINKKKNDSYGDQKVRCYYGTPYIEEEMEGLRFRIGPKSFYQTNSAQAYALYKVARDFAQLTGEEVVYDLYTGTGTIAQFVAQKAKQVIGIEYVPEAIEDAKTNAKLNGLENTLFYAGDMKDLLNEEFLSTHPRPDVIITDPPRAGMHPDVVEMLRRIGAPKIVYISCNSATQARDIELLNDMYEVTAIQSVDMFPHTHHVENVALLEKKTKTTEA